MPPVNKLKMANMRREMAKPVPKGWEHYGPNRLRHTVSGDIHSYAQAWGIYRAEEALFQDYLQQPIVVEPQFQGQRLSMGHIGTVDMGMSQPMQNPLHWQQQLLVSQPRQQYAHAGYMPFTGGSADRTQGGLEDDESPDLGNWSDAKVARELAELDETPAPAPVFVPAYAQAQGTQDVFMAFKNAASAPAPVPAVAQAQGTQDIFAESNDLDLDPALISALVAAVTPTQAQGTKELSDEEVGAAPPRGPAFFSW